ncbi:transposase, mutator type (plasmid) [Mycoplasmopsis cynos]|uniref:Mutator family transposase n=1 Tax=Mycoplasmopsis cynos TaxID=171284 RepID=A0A449AIV0_9BACT|nr:transposase [Mycoplasmopsis cynos]VEU64938.1 transposase, mutator type [Mycoplasmopsis cynos]
MKKSKNSLMSSKELYEKFKPTTIEEVYEIVKNNTKNLIQSIPEEEMKKHLGYDRYEHENRIKNNYRNGSYKKSVKSSFGNVELEIPRDINSEFEPHIIPKYQYDISKIESQIINLYSKGVSTIDISDTLDEIYGVDVDPSFVSRVTDKIMPQIVEWQNRPLERTYAMIFIDGNRFKVKEENGFVEKVGLYCYGLFNWRL